MRRTQLYLDDELWLAMHNHSRETGKSISELTREALRERYLGNLERRRKAMLDLIGIRKDRPEFKDSGRYIRSLRQGDRLDRIGEEE